jgi:tetratricopeptide (TPR) repeat protein
MSSRVGTKKELEDALQACGATAVADLSLGSSRAHSLARQLLEQLDVMPALPGASSESSVAASSQTLSYGHIIDQHVDAEARGDAAVVIAFDLARQLVATGLRTAAVIAPRFGVAWAREDELFIGLCATLGIHTNVIECHGEGHGRLHVAAAVPSVLYGALAKFLGNVPHLQFGNVFVIAPEARCKFSAAKRFVFDQLAELASSEDLKAFAQLHGSNLYVDAKLLSQRAWRNFALGGAEFALQMLETARACTTSLAQRGALLCQVQGMRIATARWEEGAAVEDPPEALAASVRQFLLESKGWSLVMSHRHEEATRLVDRAAELIESSNNRTRERSYLLNIRALCAFRSGDVEAALAFEKEIERGLDQLAPRSWPLVYVNAINQARIYRRLGDLDRSFLYYTQAFKTTLGARTETDHFYSNACLARVEQERGRMQEALRAWIRASLHWCSAELPEAVGKRALGAVLTRTPDSTFESDEAVSRAMIERLIALAGPRDSHTAQFITRGTAIVIAGADGWSVGASAKPTSTPRRSGEFLNALRGWLASYIASETGVEAAAFIVDDRDGCEMAATEREAIETALRLGATRVAFNQTEVRIVGKAVWRIAPCVATIERSNRGARVSFKRYFAPREITEGEAALLERLAAGEEVEWLDDRANWSRLAVMRIEN